MSAAGSVEEAIDRLVKVNLDAADTTPGTAKRGQHPKHHACVSARFTVRDDLPDDVRVGLFSTPGGFPALIRFSNGRVWDDRKADAHGMAIKLLDVPGPKLTKGHENERAVDFVLVDTETFFTGDLDEYSVFTSRFLGARRWPLLAPFFWIRIMLLQPALFSRVQAFISGQPGSPLEIPYFSTTPYRLGPHAVKYVVRPRLSVERKGPVKERDGLARVLVETLAVREIVFDFGVDIQTDTVRQPIEDPTIQWSAISKARREWVGVITIPAQRVSPAALLGQDLAFSPWHTLEEHRPIGRINEARAPVYLKMATVRHISNGVRPIANSEIPSRHGEGAIRDER